MKLMKKIGWLVVGSMVFSVSAVQAADITWDGDTDNTYEDGSNWVGDVAPADDLSTDTAVLTGDPVDLATARQVDGLEFSSGSTLTGTGNLEIGTSGIEVGGNSTIGSGVTFNQANTDLNLSGGTLDITGQIFGSGDITINDTGASDATVHLHYNSNDSSFTGDYNVNNGAVLRSERHSLRLAGGGGLINLDAGEIAADGDHLDLGGRDITLTANGGTIRHSHARNVFGSSDISGTGELTLANEFNSSTAGRIQLQGANTYSGGTHITHGGQAWSYSDASFGAAGTQIRMSDGGTYFAANSVNLGTRNIVIENSGLNARFNLSNKETTLGGDLAGSGDVDVVGSGSLVIASAGNTYSGNMTIESGATVKIGGSAGSFGTGSVTLDGGEIANNGGTHMSMGGISSINVTTNGGTLRHAHARNMHSMSGFAITGDGELTMAGGGSDSGRIQLQGVNTYTGGTRLIDGAQAWAYNNDSFGTGAITFDGGDYFAANGIDLGSRDIVVQGTGEFKENNKATTIGGTISGAGALSFTGGGNGRFHITGNGTHSGGVTIDTANVWLSNGDGLGTSAITLDNNGELKNNNSNPTVANGIIIGGGGGSVSAGWNKSLTLDGIISGAGTLTVESDSGVVYFNGNSTHSGLLSVAGGGKIGGNGALDGNLTIDAGGLLVFSETDTLDVAGAVTLDSTFGIDDLIGISSSTADGTYTLIGETASTFAHIENYGIGNAFNLGGGKSAYFSDGSLQVTVIPEPATLSLFVALGAGMMFLRNRFRF